ncbi:MAG: Gfo/Idh/MocA family protein [Candidatus Bathyarchaeia archaeon]
MVDKIRLGFVGCGGIAEAHLKRLIENPYAEIDAFCDIRLTRAEEISKRYGTSDAKTFTDAKSMFDKVDLDAVYFCLPPFAHGAEMEAVQRGIPFFVEKPINLYLDQAKRIAEAIEERQILTSVGYMNRYRNGVKKVRELLREDPPILVLGGWVGKTPRLESGASILTWWIRKEKSGGQFHEQVTHTVDLARFLCGEISEIHAYPAIGINEAVPENYNIEDASAVNLKFVNGAVGSLWASCSADGGGGGVSMSIYANRTTALFTGWEHSLRLLRKDAEPEEIPGEPSIFAIEDEAFVRAVRWNDPSKVMCSYSDAIKTLEVTLAANKSMVDGSPIKIHHN